MELAKNQPAHKFLKLENLKIYFQLSWKNQLKEYRCKFKTDKLAQSAITCSKLTIKALEQGVKNVQS